jgi:hypothetical protein
MITGRRDLQRPERGKKESKITLFSLFVFFFMFQHNGYDLPRQARVGKTEGKPLLLTVETPLFTFCHVCFAVVPPCARGLCVGHNERTAGKKRKRQNGFVSAFEIIHLYKMIV